MVGNDRIRDLARVIVARHGDASLAVAVDRVRLWREAGDEAWASIWTRVAGEVRRMTSGSAERRPRFDQPSLPELLDDPVMTAMLRGDEERRDEVVATLSSVKRKLRH